MENVARAARAIEAPQVVVAVVVARGCLPWGHLALVNVWGEERVRQVVRGKETRPNCGLTADPRGGWHPAEHFLGLGAL